VQRRRLDRGALGDVRFTAVQFKPATAGFFFGRNSLRRGRVTFCVKERSGDAQFSNVICSGLFDCRHRSGTLAPGLGVAEERLERRALCADLGADAVVSDLSKRRALRVERSGRCGLFGQS
jgi:hypothetical protein